MKKKLLIFGILLMLLTAFSNIARAAYIFYEDFSEYEQGQSFGNEWSKSLGFSLSAVGYPWVLEFDYKHNLMSSGNTIVEIGDSGSFVFQVILTNTQLRFEAYDGDQYLYSTPCTAGQWYHFKIIVVNPTTYNLTVTDKETGEVVFSKVLSYHTAPPDGNEIRIIGYSTASIDSGMLKVDTRYFDNIKVSEAEYPVTFNVRDALTGQSLTGVTVKENETALGTVDDGGSLYLQKGIHTLTFEKSGYWSVTKTIDVQDDMSVSVEMYPSSTAFKFLNFPSDIEVYENTIYELTFTISPITTDATYNTYLSINGLSNVLEVKKAGQAVSPDSSGKYYLGDIPSDTQISIKFKAGSIGTHAFSITLTSGDAVGSTTYTTTKQVSYSVIPLPFSVQMPSEWQVGSNQLRISESSGQSILITAILKDSQGTEVWSDSASLGTYEAYIFNVNVPNEGSYTLELQFNGQTAIWDITVNPAIVLLTDTITAKEGDIATVQVKISNPSSETKYYDIVLTGAIIEGNVTKSVSVAPLSEKTIDVSFQVPKDLTYDAYDLNVKVYEGDALQFTGIVHLVIDSGGGFLSIFGGGSSSIDSTWLWIGAGVLALFVIVAALRRR